MFFERGSCLQRLGRVLGVTPSLSIVVKVETPPKIGAAVVDEQLHVIGKVFDIIGPVSSPYVVVKPQEKNPEKYQNKLLYVSPSKQRR
jgi:RNA-binding protein